MRVGRGIVLSCSVISVELTVPVCVWISSDAAAHFDRLGERADFERDLDVGGTGRDQALVVDDRGLEARERHGHGVRAGIERRDGKGTFGVRHGVGGHASVVVLDHDGGAGNDAAGRIGDRSSKRGLGATALAFDIAQATPSFSRGVPVRVRDPDGQQADETRNRDQPQTSHG